MHSELGGKGVSYEWFSRERRGGGGTATGNLLWFLQQTRRCLFQKPSPIVEVDLVSLQVDAEWIMDG